MMLLVTATIAFGAILLAALYFRRLVSAFTGNLGQRLANPQSGTPGDKITLHSIYLPVHNCGGTRSPFTTKVEAYLRLAGLEYDTKPADLVSSPNGRIPWMQHGPHRVADSRFIVKFLQNTYGSRLKTTEPQDAHGRALSTVIQRLCEQHVYFTALYHSAATPQGRKDAHKIFESMVSWPMVNIIARAWWQGRTTQLRYQGVLTNSDEDINILIAEDFAALAALLGNRPFLFGSQPSAADACVFGFLEAHTHGPDGTPLARAVRKHTNLVRFVDNIQKQCFADKLQQGAPKHA